MHQVYVDRVMDVSASDAWSIIDDFGGVYRFHPRVERSPIQNGIGSGLGAQRTCHFDDGNEIREEITAYQPGRGYQVEITDPGSFPLTRAVAQLAVEPLESGRSRVTFRMEFKPKFGPLGWVMGKTVMEGQFRKVLSQVLDGLERHARTGEIVSREARVAAG